MYTSLPGFNFAHKLLASNHVLIGGCTGSGKSVLLSDILWTLSGYNPHDDKYILVDLKRVELNHFKRFPHCIRFVNDKADVIPVLDRLVDIMNTRYSRMEKLEQRQSKEFRIYLIIDEFTQVLDICGKQAELKIAELLRMARAANIHLILATQDVSRKAIPASIQKNIVTRVGLACETAIDSKQIIGIPGCEQLPDYGYAYLKQGRKLDLFQVPMISDTDIQTRLNYWKKTA